MTRSTFVLFALTVAMAVPSVLLAQSGPSPSQQAAMAANPAAPPQAAPTEPGWVPATVPASAAQQTAQTAPQQQQGGFPPETVIAPPTNYGSTSYGPQSYGQQGPQPQQATPQGQGGNQGQASNGNQSVPAPPILTQARNINSPLSPDEIRELHRDYESTRQAQAERPVNAVPRISSIAVDLSPGGAPPVVRTMRGEPTTLVFLDATGAPWPLALTPSVATDGLFDVHWFKDSAAVVMTAQSGYGQSGMAVFLKGLATPIVIKLVTGDEAGNPKARTVDYRLDLHVPGRGPNAKASFMGPSRIGMYDDALQAFLDGAPPTGAKRIRIEGDAPAQTQVWSLEGSLYLRTPLDIRSAYEQTMSSADGMHIYKLDPTPLVSVSQGGQSVSLTLDIE